jgi:hypothetical protein
MDDIRQATVKHRPTLFCFSVVIPVVIMLLAVRISAQFRDPPHSGYTTLSIILCSALSAVILASGLAIWGWTRGERPRLLAFVGPFISVWFLWRLLFV